MEFKLEKLASHGKRKKKERRFLMERDVYQVDDTAYTNMNKLTADYHTNCYFMRSRMENGMTAEEAAKMPINRRYRVVADHNGKTFSCIEEMCEYYNISVATFRSRRNVFGMSLKDALTTPVKKTGRPKKDRRANNGGNGSSGS